MECEGTTGKDKSVVAVGSKKTGLENPELFLTSFQLTKGNIYLAISEIFHVIRGGSWTLKPMWRSTRKKAHPSGARIALSSSLLLCKSQNAAHS